MRKQKIHNYNDTKTDIGTRSQIFQDNTTGLYFINSDYLKARSSRNESVALYRLLFNYEEGTGYYEFVDWINKKRIT